MTPARERLIEWLRDAYAAEEQAQTLLHRTAKQVETTSNFNELLEQHSARSAEHAEQLKACLDQLGEGPSLIKTVTGQIVALAQSISGYVVDDEPVKALLATATFARMEVVSYQILAITADSAGENGIAATCRSILTEKVRFSEWLEDQVADVTTDYLAQEMVAGRS
jgi:ferritin-like metal-binding protein YciE